MFGALSALVSKKVKFIFFSLFLGLSVYIFLYFQQMNHVEEICNLNKVGNTQPNIELLEKQYSVHIVGPYQLKDKKIEESLIICAPLTMCETNCSITIEDNKITKSIFHE